MACERVLSFAAAIASPTMKVKVRSGVRVKHVMVVDIGLAVDVDAYRMYEAGCGEERRCTLQAIRA